MKIQEVYSANQIYEFISRIDERKFYEFTIKLLNSLTFKNRRGIRDVIVDGTDFTDWFKLVWSANYQEKFTEKNVYWGYSSSKGYYMGLKLTIALDCKTMQPIAMILHERSPNDWILFEEIMHELKKKEELSGKNTDYTLIKDISVKIISNRDKKV